MKPEILEIGKVKLLEDGRYVITGWIFDCTYKCDKGWTIEELKQISESNDS